MACPIFSGGMSRPKHRKHQPLAAGIAVKDSPIPQKGGIRKNGATNGGANAIRSPQYLYSEMHGCTCPTAQQTHCRDLCGLQYLPVAPFFAMVVPCLFGGERVAAQWPDWIAVVPFAIWLPQLPHCVFRIYLVLMSSQDAARPAVEKSHSSCWQQVT